MTQKNRPYRVEIVQVESDKHRLAQVYDILMNDEKQYEKRRQVLQNK